MTDEKKLILYLLIWIGATVFMILFRLRKKMTGMGLVFGYCLSLWTLHWLAATIYIMPWYTYAWTAIWYKGFTPEWVEIGFRESTYAIVAFSLGSVFFPNFLLHVLPVLKKNPPVCIPDPRLPKAYFLGGLLFYFILAPTIGRFPTLSAITSGGVSLVLVGVCLALWQADQEKKRGRFLVWFIGSSIGLPLLTLLVQGFLSFGAASFLMVYAFISSFFRPRWKVVIVGIFIWYVGLSFFVTYMRDREDIREVVWRREPIWTRAASLIETMNNFEWLDLNNQDHLVRLDARLNQNVLVGASVDRLAASEDYAHGSTIRDAFLALIPRFFWPDKPFRFGGNVIVARYAGQSYTEESSTIGVGQVMEFYVNFGRGGVLVGFVCLSIIIGIFDGMAKKHLLRGDWQGFTFWFLSGLGFLQAEGTLAEVVVRAATNAVMASLVNWFLREYRGRKIISQGVTLR